MKLTDMGYERAAARWRPPASSRFGAGSWMCSSLTEEVPWRIELWGDEIDSIRSFDPESQRSIENLESILHLSRHPRRWAGIQKIFTGS